MSVTVVTTLPGTLSMTMLATDTMVHGTAGYNAGKKTKGRKRHAVVDTLGLLLCVVVTAANLPDRDGGKQVLEKVSRLLDQAVTRLYLICVDGGYRGPAFLEWAMESCRWGIQVVLRPKETKGFVLLKKRWVVKRTFGWWNGYRRLSKDYRSRKIAFKEPVSLPLINNTPGSF